MYLHMIFILFNLHFFKRGTLGELDPVCAACSKKAKIKLNITLTEALKRLRQNKSSVTYSDLRPGICETTFLLRNGQFYAHKASRSRSKSANISIIYLRHKEFFFSLMRTLQYTGELLRVKIPDIIFNLETQDNPTCRYSIEERQTGSIKAVKGLIHHSFCSPELCDGILLLPMSYNQEIQAMSTTKKMDSRSARIPWAAKKDKLIWRGSNAGKMVELSRFGWKLSATPREKAVKMCKNRKDADVHFGFVPWEVLTRHKYVLALAGNTYSSLFKHALRSGSCILRQSERMYEWFEPFLFEWKHYIPVKWDLSDLLPRLEWIKTHEEVAQKVGRNAHSIGNTLFSPEFMACYTYCSLLQFRKEMIIDFEDVNILQSFAKVERVCSSKLKKKDSCEMVGKIW